VRAVALCLGCSCGNFDVVVLAETRRVQSALVEEFEQILFFGVWIPTFGGD